jgi:deazaflavin-dependent oxidoreductase (nitroreductase family)
MRHHPDLEHAVEYRYLDVRDLDRKRLRATSDAGTDYAIVLPRDSALADGAELLLESDRAVVVCAGAPRTMTLWYWNLIANPNASIEVGDEHLDVHAVELSGEERDAKYAEQAQRYPQYAEYRRTTTRTIPVVALIPNPATS